ncbi:UNVERIFIED_CONTAM: Adenylate isopentenyltransferase 5, chloroplastic [Sesamum indicum]
MTNFTIGGVINKHRGKDKVVVVLGATGTGKSRLAIDLATRSGAEVINSDKIEVYKGLDIVTNKVSNEECRGVAHHLFGIIDLEVDFTVYNFVHHVLLAADTIVQKNWLPIIAGGSNCFIQALVNDDTKFPYMRAIGVLEMDEFFRSEGLVDGETRDKLFKAATDEIKINTCKLGCRRVEKILRMREEFGWKIHQLNATEVFLRRGGDANEAWEKLVLVPSMNIVARFICKENIDPKPTAYEQLV